MQPGSLSFAIRSLANTEFASKTVSPKPKNEDNVSTLLMNESGSTKHTYCSFWKPATKSVQTLSGDSSNCADSLMMDINWQPGEKF
jgi:hypothetical protein